MFLGFSFLYTPLRSYNYMMHQEVNSETAEQNDITSQMTSEQFYRTYSLPANYLSWYEQLSAE